MLEAKDTVIKNEGIMDLEIPCETCDSKPAWGFPTRECMEGIALKHREFQAEVSFKAGYRRGKSDGIKEVVEFVTPKLDKINALVGNIRGDWTDPRTDCRAIWAILEEIGNFLKPKGIE